jgi:hypothetical protein
MEERVSEWLTSQIELFDLREGYRPSAADRNARFYLTRIAEELIEGREAFTDERFEILERALRSEPEITEHEIDRVFATRTLAGISGMTHRVVDLSKLQSARIPSPQTETYVREAARSYLYGLFQASVVMTRAALEQALKEVLELQGVEDFIPFADLRKQASKKGILDDVTGPATKDLFSEASGVTHHKPTDSGRALSILERSRGLIEQIYDKANRRPQRP